MSLSVRERHPSCPGNTNPCGDKGSHAVKRPGSDAWSSCRYKMSTGGVLQKVFKFGRICKWVPIIPKCVMIKKKYERL